MSENPEVWLPVVGYERLYEVSSLGNVRGVSRVVASCYGSVRTQSAKLLTQRRHGGYCRVHLSGGANDGNRMVHRLVAEAFIPNPLNSPFVNHKNFNRSDNSVENLEWVTTAENNRHTYSAGRHRSPRGAAQGASVVIESTDENGNVERFCTMTDASEAVGVKIGTISSAIHRGKKIRGRTWRRIGKNRLLCRALGIELKGAMNGSTV